MLRAVQHEHAAPERATASLHELGPVLPSRGAVHAQARELAVLAKRAVEFSTAGPGANLPAALLQLERMRAILGGSDG